MAEERLQKALKEYHRRYQAASQREKSSVLGEFCRLIKYHRKYAIVLLNKPDDTPVVSSARRRGVTYSAAVLRIIERIWKPAGYPWSERLKALLPLWLPWAHKQKGWCDCSAPTSQRTKTIASPPS